MARDHRAAAEQGLALKKTGNRLVKLLGGRPIHPVSVRVGGFSRVPRRSEIEALRPELEAAIGLARATLDLVIGLDAPTYEREPRLVALRHPAEYPFNDGRIASSDGVDLRPSDWRDVFHEEHHEGSNALHARTADGGVYLLGPAARVALCGERLHPLAAEALRSSGLADRIRRNPYWSIAARAIELIGATAEALDIVDAYRPPSEPMVAWTPRPGVGAWATEAPRGLLFHRYEVDGRGRIAHAQIVPPTSQNQGAIEADLTAFAPQVLDLPHAEATVRIEQLIRSYDPCISCATHFLDLSIERG
jgi:coenzyme F420-reducing hydrogenase alpha subunit